MKKLVAFVLLGCSLACSGFIGLDLRPSFSFEIFSSPYYRILNKKQAPAANAKIGFVPVMLDARAARNLTFKDAWTQPLLQAMTRFTRDSLKLAEVNVETNKLTDAPDIFLGSVLQGERPHYILADCPDPKSSPEYCLKIGGQAGSKAWMEKLKAAMAKQGLDYALILQLGEGYIYPNGQMKKLNRMIETRKAPQAGLDMGTNYWLPMSQKWVATNKPIDVLFMKGMLVTKEGKVLRLGAEGITAASKAHFLEQVVNISHEFSEEELNAVENNVRREDLPGQPVSWQVAARQLVQTLSASNLNTSGGYIQQ